MGVHGRLSEVAILVRQSSRELPKVPGEKLWARDGLATELPGPPSTTVRRGLRYGAAIFGLSTTEAKICFT